MSQNCFKKVIVAFVALLSAMPLFADNIEVWNIGKLQAVVEKVEDNAAGKVFVSPVELTSEDQIVAVDGFYQTEPYLLVAPGAYSQETRMTWYYYAKANPGYEFKGFVTTKAGTPSSTALDNLVKVGDFYQTSGKTSACGARTQNNPVPLARYAVFEKVGTGESGEEGNDTTALVNIKAVGATYAKTLDDGTVAYENLVGAHLVANGTGTFQGGDQVTHIFVKFDSELADINMTASKLLSEKVSLVNKTNGMNISFNQYNCVVWGKDNTVIDLMLSSENYINSEDFQGEYEFSLPAGAVKSAKGAVNDAYVFNFIYGDTTQTVVADTIALADYVGVWKQKKEAGETVENPASFYVEKIGEQYYVTNLYGNKALNILIVNDDNHFSLAATTEGAYSFGTVTGGAVGAVFTEDKGDKAIFIEQFQYLAPRQTAPVYGGECYFVRSSTDVPTGISILETGARANQMYDLQGRRIATPVKGLYIMNGKKYVK